MAEQPKESQDNAVELIAEISEAYLLALKGALKPGAKTSEMWIAVIWGVAWIVIMAGALLGQFGAFDPNSFDLLGFLILLFGTLAGVAPMYKYIDGRSKVKAAYYQLPEYTPLNEED